MSTIAERVAARYLKAASIKWKGNKAEGKHTLGELKKERSGWDAIVKTNFGRKDHLETDGAKSKADVKSLIEELMAWFDKEIERAGRENWS